MICPCGKSFEGNPYVFTRCGKNGLIIIYAICQHGTVVIDKREENAKV